MPIRQEQMIEQIQEARAAHTYGTRLRDTVLEYLRLLPSRYPGSEIQEIATGLAYAVQLLPKPDDRVTYDNERYYKRHAKANSNFRAVQEQKRRERGVPTQEEAIAMLHARNAIIRNGGEVVQTYAQFNAQAEPKRQKHKRGQRVLIPLAENVPQEFDEPSSGQENSGPQPTLSLDIPPDPYDNDT